MTITDIKSPKAVLDAMAEFDRLGRDQFLKKYGFKQSRSYLLLNAGNRDASHPVNAILNYAYAVLESHVRIDIVSLGYDPTIGYLHAFEKYRAALICDLMEPLRPVVDQAVLEFVQSQTFERADFTLRNDGVCRLNPTFANHVVKLSTAALSVSIPAARKNNLVGTYVREISVA